MPPNAANEKDKNNDVTSDLLPDSAPVEAGVDTKHITEEIQSVLANPDEEKPGHSWLQSVRDLFEGMTHDVNKNMLRDAAAFLDTSPTDTKLVDWHADNISMVIVEYVMEAVDTPTEVEALYTEFLALSARSHVALSEDPSRELRTRIDSVATAFANANTLSKDYKQDDLLKELQAADPIQKLVPLVETLIDEATKSNDPEEKQRLSTAVLELAALLGKNHNVNGPIKRLMLLLAPTEKVGTDKIIDSAEVWMTATEFKDSKQKIRVKEALRRIKNTPDNPYELQTSILSFIESFPSKEGNPEIINSLFNTILALLAEHYSKEAHTPEQTTEENV